MEANPGSIDIEPLPCIEIIDGEHFVSTLSSDSSGRRLFLGVSDTDISQGDGKFPIITLPFDIQPSNPDPSKQPPKWCLFTVLHNGERFFGLHVERKTIDIFQEHVVAVTPSCDFPLGKVASCKCPPPLHKSAVSICGIHNLRLDSPFLNHTSMAQTHVSTLASGIHTVRWEIHPEKELPPPRPSVLAFVAQPSPGQQVKLILLGDEFDIEPENRMFVVTRA